MSKFGVDRLEVYDTPDDVLKNDTSRIITLDNCIKITPKPPNLFTVYTKTTQYDFATLTEQDLNEWVAAFQSVAFKEDTSKLTHIEEDNDLYCSSAEGVFSVKLSPSKASNNCGLEPKHYTLVLTSTAIQLRETSDNKLLYTWPYCYIRRYGYCSGKFTFEAGRKCETGEGIFHLEHSNQQEVFRCLSSKMKSMKKILSGESTTSLLDCGDNQFHAALSMEARSRSPLPPSPTSSTRLQDFDGNSAQSSMKSLVSFTDSVEKSVNNRLPMPKPKPTKPPRKNPPSTFDLTKNNVETYEPVLVSSAQNKKGTYAEIEYRQEAWRTLGVDTIKHTESVNDLLHEELEEYMSWSRLKNQNDNAEISNLKSKKIIINASNEGDESYDKLQFFGSSSKLSNIQPGYKQVAPVPIPAMPFTPSWNDYDEVEVNMQAVRLADDSHLGYGVIRKAPLPPKPIGQKVPHKVYNDATYAIVSKPKRV